MLLKRHGGLRRMSVGEVKKRNAQVVAVQLIRLCKPQDTDAYLGEMMLMREKDRRVWLC
jgi:hypothetical protein